MKRGKSNEGRRERAFSLRAARGEGGRRPDEGSGRQRRRASPLTPALSPCSAKGEGEELSEASDARSELVLRNRQRDRRLNLPFLRRVLTHTLRTELGVAQAELCFHFVTAEEMARVNWQFLQHEGSTDVITFDYGERSALTPDARRQTLSPLSGEAFICVADAVKQAREFRTTWQSEVVRYVVHALLHLRGYDDLEPAKRRVMKREENRLVSALGRRFEFRLLQRRAARESRE